MAGLVQKEERVPSEQSGEAPPVARFFGRRPKLQSPSEALQPETPPPPPNPHKRRPTLSALSGFLSFLMIVALAGLFGVVWGAHRLQEPGPLPADKVLYIAPGTEVPDIVASLQEEGIIDNPLVFNIALLVEGYRSKVKAGEYLFKQNASMHEVMETLVNGKQILHPVTVPEGLTSEQVVDLLRKNDLLLGDINDVPKEGSLLPETYKIARGMSRANLIKWMQEDEKKLVGEIWAHRSNDLSLRSPYELVTLASIVEKETGKADERPRVAAVFLNRLQKRMRLQSDPTIVYGIVGGKGTLGRAIDHADVERATPYNTYAIEGLPPGPIANPGRAALEAVANPSRTQDLYFVADGTGGHVFSETLEQHQRNVAHWRQIEKEAKDKAGSDVDKYIPLPPTGRPDQHTENDSTSVYGALPTAFAASGPDGSGAVLSLAPGAAAIAAVSPTMPNTAATAAPAAPQTPVEPSAKVASAAPPPQPAKASKGAALASYALGPGLDDLGITVRGVSPPPAATKLLDGPMDSSQNAATTTVASSQNPAELTPEQKAEAQLTPEQRAEAARLGMAFGNADSVTGKTPPKQPPAHPRIYDVSEGTPLDPLRDKTYDLNYPKTVPSASELK